MSVLITDAKVRLADIAVECMAALTPPVIAIGKPFFWVQDVNRFPYFTVRTGTDNVEWDSEDFDRDTYTLVLRLVVGHLTSGYKGEREEELDTWIPALKTYINERELLQSDNYPVALNGLIRARVTSISGYSAFPNSGLAVQQVGTDFNVSCEFDETIEQAYN